VVIALGGFSVLALSIKNAETERLARQVAEEAGESLTQAIERALKERLQRLRQLRRRRVVAEKVLDILRRVDSLPTLDKRPEEDILGYDDQGIPR
jgi:antitoxin VapB